MKEGSGKRDEANCGHFLFKNCSVYWIPDCPWKEVIVLLLSIVKSTFLCSPEPLSYMRSLSSRQQFNFELWEPSCFSLLTLRVCFSQDQRLCLES